MWQIAALCKKNSGGKLEYAKIPPKITKLSSRSFRSKRGKTRAFCIAASCHRRSFISSFPAIRPRTGCGTERESGTLLPPIWNRAGTVGEAGRRARIPTPGLLGAQPTFLPWGNRSWCHVGGFQGRNGASDAERVAVVTDVEWIKQTMRFFSFLMPGAMKSFPTSEAAHARVDQRRKLKAGKS